MSKWEVLTFNDVIVDETKNATKIKKEEYLLTGKYHIIDQGQAQVAGYTNYEDGVYTEVPAIIFGDHTRIIKYVDKPLYLGADGVKLLKTKSDCLDYKFLYYFFVKNEVPNTGYNRHFKWLKELSIPIPPIDVQRRITDTLDKIQEIIDGHKKQLEELGNLIKATFYNMFGDPVTNQKGWPCCIVGKTIKALEAGWSADGEQREKGNDEIAVLKVSAVTSGFFKETEYKVLNKSLEVRKYVFPHKGDLLFSRANTRELVAATCLIFDDYPDLLLPDKLWRIEFNDLANFVWMKYVLSDTSIRKGLSNSSTGTSGSMYNVSMNKLKSTSIPLPPVELQAQFADIVYKIEEQKAIVKQSIIESETLFNSLMSKYFD